jgi:ATP-dependent protease ClpP protease subunit
MKRLFVVLGLLASLLVPTRPVQAEPNASPAPAVPLVAPGSLQGRIAVVRFIGDIDGNSQMLFDRTMDQINAGNPKAIVLIITSPGGELDAGYRMIQTIEQSKAPVHCLVDVKAHSMALALFESCKTRGITKRSSMMMHQVRSTMEMSTAEEMRTQARQLEVLTEGYVEQVIRRSNITKDVAYKHIGNNGEWWFTAEKAVTAGLADKVWASQEAFIAAEWLDALQQEQPNLQPAEQPLQPAP